jgi:hypothetical protein
VAKSNTSEEKVNRKTRRKARMEGEAIGMFYSHFRNFGGVGVFIPFATEWNQRERKLLQDGRCPGPSFSPTWTPQ